MTTTSPSSPPSAPARGRPSGRARRVLLGLGTLLSLALIAWGVLWLINLFGRTSEERSSVLPATGDRLSVASPVGAIRITGADVDQIEVRVRLRYGLQAPRLEQEPGPDGIRLSAACPWYGFLCSADYEVRVPTRMDVWAKSSGGSITIRAVGGRVEASSSGGSVRVEEVRGAVLARSSGGDVRVADADGVVDLDSSGGEVTGERLRGAEATAESSGGDVRLDFAAAPRDVRARSSGGEVEVLLPRVDGGYRVDADTSGGERRVDVPTDPASSRSVRAQSSGGDVTVTLTGQA
jgi:hypothetical protein